MTTPTDADTSRQSRKGDGRPSNRDFEFFYRGLAVGKLLVQQCKHCGAFRNPPAPMCGNCQSLEWSPIECQGIGTIFSYTVHHHPPLTAFPTPHAIVLAEMREGFRLVGALRGWSEGEIQIGAEVVVEFAQDGEHPAFFFRFA